MKTREPKLQTQAREKLGTENPGAPIIWTEGKLQQRGETQLLEYWGMARNSQKKLNVRAYD